MDKLYFIISLDSELLVGPVIEPPDPMQRKEFKKTMITLLNLFDKTTVNSRYINENKYLFNTY